MFKKILIANRGEIALRVICACKDLGIRTVAVYSEADRHSLHTRFADEAICIGPSEARRSYLSAPAVISAALVTGCDAIHPGYGFLSESAPFARAVLRAGLTWVGPPPEAIEEMGGKLRARARMEAAGVPVTPGSRPDVVDDPGLLAEAARLGFPLMIKASAGGGGKGIRVAKTRRDVEEGFAAVQAEARGAFGDDRVFIEKFIERPRHIEIQVLGDKHGHVVHLFERECSIQRRNQKVIEEAPSPLLDEATRAAMGAQATALAKAVDYDSAGTVEFVAAQDKAFYFLEMNTRLQVEHPVTELITGTDLVEQMIRVAAGEPLGFGQADLAINGWAIESRIYAEDPYRKFLPSIGRLRRYRPPAEGNRGDFLVRNDTGVREGDEISIHYDPMIAKLCIWAPDRKSAIHGMARALEDFHIEGVGDNTPFLSAVMDQARFALGELSTDYIPEEFPAGFHGLAPTPWQEDLIAATACAMHRTLSARALRLVDGLASPVPRTRWVVVAGKARRNVEWSDEGEALKIQFTDEGRAVRLETLGWRPGSPQFHGRLDGQAFTATVAPLAEGFAIRHRAARATVMILTPASADLHQRLPAKAPVDTSRLVTSPMPGLVVSMEVALGMEVKEGQVLCVIEAMKMQNIIRAERDGVIKGVGAKAGDSVAADDVLAEFA